MKILVEALECEVIIGLLDFERERTQRVLVDLELNYNYSSETFIDYADLVLLIEKELKEKRYELLEEALFGIKAVICRAYPHILSLTLKVAKPDIIPNCSVALSDSWTF
jgi:dihydroneopterin aldolase